MVLRCQTLLSLRYTNSGNGFFRFADVGYSPTTTVCTTRTQGSGILLRSLALRFSVAKIVVSVLFSQPVLLSKFSRPTPRSTTRTSESEYCTPQPIKTCGSLRRPQ